jgi:peptidoglycan-associated lipoprotein
MRILSNLTIALSSVLLFSACSTVKLDEKPPVEERTGSAPMTTPGADPRTVGTITATQQAGDPLNDPQGVLAKRSIYFDLDSYIVREEFRPVIEAHARYLTSNRGRKIAIQGHTDERGGSEYNLALGQKRAETIRKSLALLGVSEGQMEAVSFGKEKPKAFGTDESAWAENRRADIVY